MSEQTAFFVKIRGRTLGPFEIARLRQMIQQGQISRINPVSTDGHQWQKAGEFAQLFQADIGQNRAAETKVAVEQSASTTAQGDGIGRVGGGSPGDATDAAGVWYYNIGDRQEGPVSASIIRDLIRNGRLSAQDHAWREGMASWSTVGELPELAALLPGRIKSNFQISTETSAPESCGAADFRETKLIIGYSSGWMTFIYFSAYAFAALNVLSCFGLIVLAFRENWSLLAARLLLSRSLVSILIAAIFVVAGVFLHRYSLSLNRFCQSQQVEDMNLALRWIGRFWILIGVCLIIILFLVLIAAVVAVAIPGSIF